MSIVEVRTSENIDPSTHTRQDVLDMAITESEMETAFDDHLSEIYPEVEICGMYYDAARALKEVDPTAYRCAMGDWRAENLDEVNPSDFPETLTDGDQDDTCPRCVFCPQCSTVTHTRLDGRCSTCLYSPPAPLGHGW